MPLERLLEDAIYHAQKNGVLVTQGQQNHTQEELDELRDVPGFAETYLFDGVVPKTRQVLKQPALGNTLARLAEVGLNDMFDGLTAQHNARYLEAVGSPLRLADFKAYRAKQVLPLQVSIVAGTLFNMPPPTQGISSLMILALFDRLRVTQGESFDHIHGLVETTKQAFTLRNAYVTDLEFMDVDPMAGWIVHFSTRWRATFMQNKRWNGLSQQNQVTQSGWAQLIAKVVRYPLSKASIGNMDQELSCLKRVFYSKTEGMDLPLKRGTPTYWRQVSVRSTP